MQTNPLVFRLIAINCLVLTAAEKYLLIRIIHLYGAALVNQPIAELESVIGLSASVLKCAREALVEKRLLTEEVGVVKEPAPGKHLGGRPPKAFRVSDYCQKLLQDDNGLGKSKDEKLRLEQRQKVLNLVSRLNNSSHQKAMERLLFWGSRNGQGNDLIVPLGIADRRVKKQISPPYGTRLLLATLYGLADRNGVVRGVGLGALARMTSLKRQSLNYQLGKLAEEGYLRAYVSGVTGRFAYGKAYGAFFLNPSHPKFPMVAPEILVCFEDRFLINHYPLHVGGRVYMEAGGCLRRQKKSGPESPNEDVIKLIKESLTVKESIHQIARDADTRTGDLMENENSAYLERLWDAGQLHQVFQDSRDEFPRYLQFKVEQYASELLSEYWGLVDQGGIISVPMLARIRQEVRPDKNWSEDEAVPYYPSAVLEALELYVYILALRMACGVKALLLHDMPAEDWQVLDKTKALITVLPVPDVKDSKAPLRMALSIVPREGGIPIISRVIGISRSMELSGKQLAIPIVTYGVSVATQDYWMQASGIKEGLKRKSKEQQSTPQAHKGI